MWLGFQFFRFELQDMASSPTAVTLGVGGAAVAGTVTNNGGTVN